MPTATHIAIVAITPNSVSEDVCDLTVAAARFDRTADAAVTLRHEATDDVISYDPLDVPMSSEYRNERAQFAADRVLTARGWTRSSDWRTTSTAMFAELTPTHGMVTMTLLAGSRKEALPGIADDDPRAVPVPGLDDHPGVYAWKAEAGVLTDSSLTVYRIPGKITVTGYPSITVSLPLLEPVHNGIHYLADLRDAQHADLIRTHPALVAGGRSVSPLTRNAVWLTRDVLDLLAELPRDHDGHYDGQAIWIGGEPYPVQALTVDEMTCLDRCPGCGSRIRQIRANVDSAGGNPCIDSWHDSEAAA